MIEARSIISESISYLKRMCVHHISKELLFAQSFSRQYLKV